MSQELQHLLTEIERIRRNDTGTAKEMSLLMDALNEAVFQAFNEKNRRSVKELEAK